MNKLHVCAAVISKGEKILISTRPPGKNMEGMWEFPGGKFKDGESPAECLRREIMEELSLDIIVLDRLFEISYEYPDKQVKLFFFRCVQKNPSELPIPREGQDTAWTSCSELINYNMLPADRPFAEILSANEIVEKKRSGNNKYTVYNVN